MAGWVSLNAVEGDLLLVEGRDSLAICQSELWEPVEAGGLHPNKDTWAFLLVARLDFLPAALAWVALHARPLAHAETSLPARVTRLGAQTPVVPGAPRAVRFGSGEQKGTIRRPF